MNIEKFHELYWGGKAQHVNDHMYYYKKALEKRRYHDDEEDGVFDAHYSMNNFSDVKFTARAIEKVFDSIDFEKFNKKKFILGDYTFYGWGRTLEKPKYYEDQNFFGFGFYMEYHGYRTIIMECESYEYINKKDGTKTGDYGKSIEGVLEFVDLLKNDDLVLLDYDEEKELIGTYSRLDENNQFNRIPPMYPEKPHKEYDFCGEPIGKIDLDHFILMETKDGVYRPTQDMIDMVICNRDYRDMIKPMNKNLSELGIHKIQFRNNANFSIFDYYDIEGIEIKASKSVLASYEEFVKFLDEDTQQKLIDEEKAREEAYKKEVADDTYTLMQNGKVIAKDVRSNDIVEYFESKESKEFEFIVIEAGKKCFEIAPNLDKIFFGSYGIYTYTEMAGEKFANCEDLKNINRNKDIELPKRLVTLLEKGVIETPYLDKDDSSLYFERGATYIGAAKDEDGTVYMIEEDGDQGI